MDLPVFFADLQGCKSTGKIDGGLTGPKGGLRFESEFHDFGEVMMGDRLEAKFPFSNVTKKALKITDLITTCGCTVAELNKFYYLPGIQGKGE